MAGRNRRASTSSVETVDENQIQWRQETSVLKSVPKASDPNGWPVFELRDAVIFNKDGDTLVNALHVGDVGPLIVRGTLIIDDPSQKRHLIMKVRGSMPIEIRQSNEYSIGEAEDGQPLIWVAGRGGWYEIGPSPKYVPIYNKMCEAATLYYRIMDVYKSEKPKKSKKGKRLDHMIELSRVFHKYAAKVGDGSTLDEVIGRCLEHAPFLLSQFLQEDPNEFNWQPTPFFNWLRNKCPDICKKIDERGKTSLPPPKSPSVEVVPPPTTQTLPSRARTSSSAPSVVTPKQNSPQVEPRANVSKQRSTRSRSVVQTDTETSNEPPKTSTVNSDVTIDAPAGAILQPYDENLTPFESVLNALEYAYEQLAKSRQGLTVMSTLNKIYFLYKFPNWRNGPPGCHKLPVEEVLQYNAAELLKNIDKEKYGKHEIYTWLQENAGKEFNPISIKPSEFPYRLVPRHSRPRISNNTETPPAVQSSNPPVQNLDDARVHNSTFPSPAGKAPRGRRAAKKGGLRLVTGSKKRLHSELESDSEHEETGLKRSHYFSDGDDSMHLDVEDDSSHENDQSSESGQDPIQIILRAEKIASTVPHGPSETWTCEEEDCGYVVRGGDAEECQERIKKHFEEHEEQADRVNLAMTESRGHLPINHLIEKLKSIGEGSQNKQITVNGSVLSVDDTLLPKPIKRNLHV